MPGNRRARTKPAAQEARPAVNLESILDSAVDAVFAFTCDFRYSYVSPAGARVLGMDVAAVVGKTWDEVHAPELAKGWKDLAAQVIENRRPARHETPFTGPGGERFYEYILTPVLDSQGRVELLVSISRDVTDRKRAEEALTVANIREQRARVRATRLHELSAALSRAETEADISDAIVHQACQALDAETAVLYLARPEGQLQLTASRGFVEGALEQLQSLPLETPLPLADAIRTAQPVWLQSRAALLGRYPHLRHAKTPSAKLQAVAAVPLRTGDRSLGGAGFSFGTPRVFDEDERRFLLTVASHAALALERRRLRQEEETARTRLTILAEASRRFSEAKLELRDTLDTIAHEVAFRLLDSCAINLLSEDEQVLEPVAVANIDREAEESTRATMVKAPVRMDESSTLAQVAKSGEPVLIPVFPSGALPASTARPEYREHHRRFPISSLIIVPLRVREKVIGTMTVARGKNRSGSSGSSGLPYTREDQALLQDLADRAALAIANARQYEQLAGKRRRLDVLAKASELLAKSLDYESTLRNVIELALPMVGDFGFFDLMEGDGQVRRLARAHQDPERQALLEQTRWVRSERRDKNLCALSTGASGYHPHIDDAWLRDVAGSPEHLEMMQKLAFCSMITVPLSYHGRTLGSLTLFFGSSGRHHSPSELRLAEELARRAAAAVENARLFKESQESIAVRDQFLSVAGHELNTPLAALQLQIQGLKRQVQKWDAADAARRVDGGDGAGAAGAAGGAGRAEGAAAAKGGPVGAVALAERSDRLMERLGKTEAHVARLGKLVNELLDVSRITAGRLVLDRESIDLVAMVRDVVERLTPHAAGAGCNLSFSVGGGQGEAIVGDWDRLRLEQVVTNLIGNSIKYGAGKPIEVTVTLADGVARISVRDFGIGISPQDEERVFGRFERAVSHRNYGGLGLGLWIARQIVEACAGSIRFERPADSGTRFVVDLPVRGAE